MKIGVLMPATMRRLILPTVCLGERVSSLKGAGVPDDTVVGIRAVVTKRFSDPYTALAGCPARVVTRDITWDAATPGAYDGAKHG